MPVDRLEIGVRGRHLDIIKGWNVIGAVAADAKVDSGGFDQRLDLRLDQAGRRWRWCNGDFVGQTFTLSRVEHGEALQEGDSVGVLAGFPGASLLVIGDEAVGIDNGGAALTLPDIAAKRKGLAESQPRLTRETMLDDSAPEDENIDTRIGPAG